MARTQEVLPPSRLRAQRQKRRFILRILWSVFFLLTVIALVGATHIKAIRVRDVVVTGTQSIPQEVLQSAILKELEGSYWLVIPKNNVAVYSASALEEMLLRAFPKIRSVEIDLKTFSSLQVEVEERMPSALWCGEMIHGAEQDTSTCMFLDRDGYAYEQAPSYSEGAYVRWFGTLSGTALPKHYLFDATFSSLQPLIESFRNPQQTPARVVVDAHNDVSVFFAEGFELRFTLAQKPEEVIVALRTAQNSNALIGKSLSDLEYLDLRFGDRLYYKFK